MDVSSIEADGYMTSKPENEELWDPGGDPQRTELVNITLSSPLHALLSTTKRAIGRVMKVVKIMKARSQCLGRTWTHMRTWRWWDDMPTSCRTRVEQLM